MRLEVSSHRILVAWSALQVTIKGVGYIQYTLDMFHAERFLVVDCQSLCGTDCVLDLKTELVLSCSTYWNIEY